MEPDERPTESWHDLDPSEQPVAGVPDIRERIERAPHVTLLLDYDGTLAPFHEDRLKAVPLPGVVDVLLEIDQMQGIDIAVVSGRPVAEVQQLLGTDRLGIAGTHGFELYRPGSEVSTMPISDDQRSALDDAELDAVETVGRSRTERKHATVAVHVRGLEPAESAQIIDQIEEQWREHLNRAQIELRCFNGGIEIRALGRHKGDTIQEFVRSSPAGSLVIYIGDDETDEDAFRALPSSGIGIKVGAEGTPTDARGWLPSCEAVRRFLWTFKE